MSTRYWDLRNAAATTEDLLAIEVGNAAEASTALDLHDACTWFTDYQDSGRRKPDGIPHLYHEAGWQFIRSGVTRSTFLAPDQETLYKIQYNTYGVSQATPNQTEYDLVRRTLADPDARDWFPLTSHYPVAGRPPVLAAEYVTGTDYGYSVSTTHREEQRISALRQRFRLGDLSGPNYRRRPTTRQLVLIDLGASSVY